MAWPKLSVRSQFGRFAASLVAVGMLWSGDAWARGPRKVPDLRKSSAASTPTLEARAVQVSLTVHLATRDGRPVMDARAFRRTLLRTNRAMARYGIEFHIASIRWLPEGFDQVHRYRQRRILAQLAPPDGTVHVFVVDSLDRYADFRIGNKVRGMYWTYRGLRRDIRGREYVLVATDAPNTTLAHELGHLFGLPHSTQPDNIMCSCREGPDTQFSRDQGQRLRRAAIRFARHRRPRFEAAAPRP